MECAALRSPLVTQSRRTSSGFGFLERRVRPLCHLVFRQQTWQVPKFRSRRWFADVGIADAISKPGFSQASSADQSGSRTVDQHRRPIDFALGEDGPCHPRQLVGQRHADDVVVCSRCELRQPRS